MAQPVYKMWMMKYTESWYKLSREEQDKISAKVAEALKSVGGEPVMMMVSSWCSENWIAWGVEKFPSMEAVQQHALLLYDLNHYEYVESTSYLGVEMPSA